MLQLAKLLSHIAQRPFNELQCRERPYILKKEHSITVASMNQQLSICQLKTLAMVEENKLIHSSGRNGLIVNLKRCIQLALNV